MNAARANLAFTCVHEADRLPAIDSEVEPLFAYGRYLEKLDGPKDFNAVARYYRIASAYGHYKANHNLQLLVSEGLASSPAPEKEAVDLATQLIKANVPGGYYDMGHYLELGYGVKQDLDKARRYFRKGADLGSPEAQYYVGELLAPRDKAPDIARQMYQCSVDQGYGVAASTLGINLKNNARYSEAVAVFQKGAGAGDTTSASFLEDAFKGPAQTDRLNYLALSGDMERSQRYRRIREFLTANEGRNPKVPDIDKIVPLPPAKLPPWDGTFQWEKEQAAAVPPEKPSEELIDRLAKAKHLDPGTGLPLSGPAGKTSKETTPLAKPDAQHADARLPIGSVAYSGDTCPEDGLWCANLGDREADGARRQFTKGETLPPLVIRASRQPGFLERWRDRPASTERVVWQLTAYPDQA
jgi:TPR repeat protein